MQHILMLSQDHAYQNALTSLLREQGFPLSSARTVEDALDQLYSKRIDLLIADLESWKEKGIAVYRQIRQELGGKDLSSIIIASLEVMQEIKFSLSFDDFGIISFKRAYSYSKDWFCRAVLRVFVIGRH